MEKTGRGQRLSRIGILFVCLLLLQVYPAHPGSVRAEEAFNGGFENVSNGKPAGWAAIGGAYAASTEQAHGGAYSVKVTDASGSAEAGVRSGQFEVTVGEAYEAYVYAYNLAGTSQLRLEFWDADDERIDYAAATNVAANHWNRIEVSGTAPANAAYATLLLYQSEANIGATYYDNASFAPDPTPPAPGNGDFEAVVSGKPAGWTTLAGQHESSTAFVRGGTYSVKLLDPSASAGTGIRSAKVSVSAGATYRASVYSYNEAGISQLYLEFWDANDVRINPPVSGTNYTTNAWNLITFEQVAPANATTASLLLSQGSANIGNAYFDDADLALVPPPPVLPFNNGFEEAVDGKPTGWRTLAGAYQTSTEQAYEGARSVKLFDPSAASGTGVRTVPIPVVRGETYQASVYSFNETGSSHLYLEFWDANNVRIDHVIGTNNGLNGWNAINLQRVAPAAAVYATLLVYQSGGNIGTAYFDKAELKPALANGGFELVADGKAVGWTLISGQYEASSAQASDGHYSAKLTDISSGNGTTVRSTVYPVVSGSVYEASIDMYVEQGKGQLYLEFRNAANDRVAVFPVAGAAPNKWKTFTVEGKAPATAVNATLLLYIDPYTIGTVYFDNALLRLKPADVVREYELSAAGHPRLYFTSADIPDLQAAAEDDAANPFGDTGAEIWAKIAADADRYLTETEIAISYYGGYQVVYPLPIEQPLPMDLPPGYTGTAYYPYWTALSRQLQTRMDVLSLAYTITGNTDYADKAKEYLLSLTSWDTWSDPSIDYGYYNGSLETAHLTLAAAAAYDMIYGYLTPPERSQAAAKLEQLGLAPLYEDVRLRIGDNIQLLRAVALAGGALAVLGEDADAEKYLSRADDYLVWYMDEAMEAGQNEGILYAAYATDNILRVADQMSRVTGESRLDQPYLDDFVVRMFQYFMSPGASGLANFGDSDLGNYGFVSMSILNSRLNNGYAGWFLANARPAAAMFDKFVYYNPTGTVTTPDPAANAVALGEIGWAAMRTGWGGEDTLFALTANNSMTGHNQYDQNSFIIGSGRTWLAADPGYKDSSPGPANAFTTKYGHNTIRVDGGAQSHLGGGDLTAGLLAPDYAYVTGSVRNAYHNPHLRQFDRHVVQVDRDYYVMMDNLQSDAAGTFDWTMFSGNLAEFEVEGAPAATGTTYNGNDLYVAKRDAQMAIRFLDDAALPITVDDYAGAEQYGLSVKVGSGSPATEHRFLTVLKAEPLLQTGFLHAADLFPPMDSSGEAYSLSAVLDTKFITYASNGVDDYMTVKLPVAENGVYRLSANFVNSPTFGKVRVELDGLPIGSEIDLYGSGYQITSGVQLGEFTLTAGDHELKLKVTGKHESATNYYIGLDSVQLEKVGGAAAPKTSIDAALVENGQALGAEVHRPGSLTDLVLFGKGSGAYSLSGVTSDADQSLVTHDGSSAVLAYAATRGTVLQYNGQTLLSGSAPLSGSFKYYALADRDSGVIEVAQATDITVYSRSAPSSVTVAGVALAPNQYTYDGLAHTIAISAAAAGKYEVQIGYTP